jgi:hypothetical protein
MLGYIGWASKQLFRLALPAPALQIDKVIIFNETDDPHCDEYSYSEYADTRKPLADLQKTISIPSYKVEVRYRTRGKKFRYIFRNGENIHFPPRRKLEMRNTLQSARIKYEDGTFKDVTARALKYAGPNGDFNASDGGGFLAFDIIPFHSDRVESLHLVVGGVPYTFLMDDAVVL